jgi:hypothetical protein
MAGVTLDLIPSLVGEAVAAPLESVEGDAQP